MAEPRRLRLHADRSIAVIGGGISGLTTAILLHLSGHRTCLYTHIRPFGRGGDRPAELATVHAAASILPHSVASPNVSRWTGISQSFFRALGVRGFAGVRSQIHYEIFEDPISAAPAYADSVENFQFLTPEALEKLWVPRRSDATATYGWKFDAFFCEAPAYVRGLYAFYAAIGGRVLGPPGNGLLASYLELDHELFVNCAGIGAYALLRSVATDKRYTDAPTEREFEPLIDTVPEKLIRGHYLRIAMKEALVGDRGVFSYNYKPVAEIYRTEAGPPADVYCYPRSDAWILGGSRQEGRVDENGAWSGQRTVGDEMVFPGSDAPLLAVPSAILRLNGDILLRCSGGRLDLERLVRADPTMVSPRIGYRFVRDSHSDSVRIGCSRVEFDGARKYVLHNYGHGGSGYTLSWGCAFDVVRLLQRMAGRPAVLPERGVRYADTREVLAGLIAGLLSG